MSGETTKQRPQTTRSISATRFVHSQDRSCPRPHPVSRCLARRIVNRDFKDQWHRPQRLPEMSLATPQRRMRLGQRMPHPGALERPKKATHMYQTTRRRPPARCHSCPRCEKYARQSKGSCSRSSSLALPDILQRPKRPRSLAESTSTFIFVDIRPFVNLLPYPFLAVECLPKCPIYTPEAIQYPFVSVRPVHIPLFVLVSPFVNRRTFATQHLVESY
jgi:hypothetical protein